MDQLSNELNAAIKKQEGKAKLNIVLTATYDILKANRKISSKKDLSSPITAIELFGAMMTTLEADAHERNHTTELLFLLSIVLKHVSPGVLKAKFSEVTQFLMSFLQVDESFESSGEEGTISKYVISCLGIMFSVLDSNNTSAMASKPVSKVLNTLLNYAVEKIPKARREAHRVLVELLSLQESSFMGEQTVKFCSSVLDQAYIGQDATQTLQLLTLLRAILPLLPHSEAYKLLLSLMKFLNVDNILLVLGSYRTISSYVNDERSSFTATYLGGLIESLKEVSPDPTSPDVGGEYIILLFAILSKLKNVEDEEEVLEKCLPDCVLSICSFFSSDDRNLTKTAQKNLRDLILTCIDEKWIDKAMMSKDGPVIQILSYFEELTSYRFVNSWSAMVEPFAAIFKVIGSYSPAAAPLLAKVTLALVQLYEGGIESGSDGEEYVVQVHRVVGVAVEYMGRESFLSIVSLSSKEKPNLLSSKREWLLPILETNLSKIHPNSLSFFGKTILSMARAHEQASRLEGIKPKELAFHHSSALKLWRLLPTWCEGATDTCVIFPNMAKTLVAAAKDARYPEMSIIIAKSIDTLIQSNLYSINHNNNNYGSNDNDNDFKNALYEEEEDEVNKDSDDDELEEEKDDDDDIFNNNNRDKSTPNNKYLIDAGVANDNINAIAPLAVKFLPLFFNLFEESHGTWPSPPNPCPHLGYGPGGDVNRSNSLLEAISSLAQITPYTELSSIFHTLMKSLLLKTKEMNEDDGGDGSGRRGAVVHMGIISGMVKALEKNDLDLLYRVVKPSITESVISLLQQRSYSVLFQMCSNHPSWVKNSLLDITTLLRSSLLTVTSSAKKSRLKSLCKVVEVIDEENESELLLMPELLGEVMLCLKESNKRARSAAFDLIVTMAHKMEMAGRVNPSGSASLSEFIKMVMGGLAATTPHMRSATVLALARLVFEYKENESLLEVAPSILKLTLMLLNEKSREVIKSVLGFTKVMISALSNEALHPFLSDICQGLLQWSGDSKNRFRQKIRHILERLVRKFDYNSVLAHIPESDIKLMSHIKKTKERANKKKNKKSGKEEDRKVEKDNLGAVGLGFGNSKNNIKMTEVENNDDEEMNNNSDNEARDEQKWVSATKKTINKNSAWLKSDGEDPLNLLDGENVARKLTTSNPKNNHRKRGREEEELDFALNVEGKMLIQESDDEEEKKQKTMEVEDEDDEEEKDVASNFNKKYNSSATKDRRIIKKAKIEGKEGKVISKGVKRAGGDVMGGKVQPYAYLPLDNRYLNKKKKNDAPRQYTNVVSSQKKKKKIEKKNNRNTKKY